MQLCMNSALCAVELVWALSNSKKKKNDLVNFSNYRALEMNLQYCGWTKSRRPYSQQTKMKRMLSDVCYFIAFIVISWFKSGQFILCNRNNSDYPMLYFEINTERYWDIYTVFISVSGWQFSFGLFYGYLPFKWWC